MRKAPPFRVDHVGSLIRPRRLVETRKRYNHKEIAYPELKAVEDEAIRAVVRMQEDAGLESVTDGEFRRDSYLTGFFGALGIELHQGRSKDLFYHREDGSLFPGTWAEIRQKIRWSGSPNVDAFRFLASVTRGTPKVTLPAPTQAHFFAGTDGISRSAYSDEAAFWDDIVAAYQAELRALGAAGCTYVQIDETCLPKLADPVIQATVAARGADWRRLIRTYAEVISRIVAGRPAAMTVALHHCRGNNRGSWMAQGGYDEVADLMFNGIDVDIFLLEYDTPRAGDFEPLRYLPAGKTALLGLVSTKEPQLETADDLKRRIAAAERHTPLDRLGICPQCGFSSGFAMAPLTEEEEIAKIRLLVDVARDVWA
jgi:5-methyltetrahydropteroyltriglutamate--homocysteine methyltransferase